MAGWFFMHPHTKSCLKMCHEHGTDGNFMVILYNLRNKNAIIRLEVPCLEYHECSTPWYHQYTMALSYHTTTIQNTMVLECASMITSECMCMCAHVLSLII